MRLLSVIVVLLFLICGCEPADSTNTGNTNRPGEPMSGTKDPASVTAIASALCSKIKACYSSANETTCQSQIMSLANFTDAMNLNPPYSTMTELKDAVTNGTFEFNSTSYSTCISAISALACTNQNVTNGYSIVSPNNYTGIYRLFQASSHCLTMKY